LYGQFVLRYIEIDFNPFVIEENPLIVGVVSIFSEKGKCDGVFKQRRLSVKEEQVKYTVVNEIVLA